MTSRHSTEPVPLTVELDWLLEISALATLTKGIPPLQDRSARLGQILAAAVAHLGCTLGALLIPGRHLRLVQVAPRVNTRSVQDALSHLESPAPLATPHQNSPLLLNRGRTFRLLRVPVGDNAPATERSAKESPAGAKATERSAGKPPAGATSGALVLLRSPEDPEFNSLHVAIARHLAHHLATLLEADLDQATGLYTRLGLQQHVTSVDKKPVGPHAVICIDIDRLHVVNKVAGFEAGDAIITRVARLLRDPALPPGAAAARISGNEFALVLPGTGTSAAEVTARALQQLAANLVDEGAPEQPISLSCGIAAFGHAGEFQRGLVLAELAAQVAKDRGRGRIEIYQDNDATMIRRNTDIFALQRLHEAMQEDRLTLFAQRIMPLHNQQEVGGYELLLRSLDPPHENHAPAALLTAALRSGLAPELDLWVIDHAIRAARPYLPELLAANVSLSINLAGPSLTDDGFLDRLRPLISRSGIPPGLIMFEVTETVALLSLTKAVKFIRELRSMGCRFALDDFGTGANSLKNLTNLPVDRVKIDGSFVSDILTNPQSAAIVRAMVTLARDLGINTVAEYAETDQIIQRLTELGVEHAQGYAIEKPRALALVLAELRSQQDRRHAEPGAATVFVR
jgi:diguanylate cyclase (GGDEF)-like protein